MYTSNPMRLEEEIYQKRSLPRASPLTGDGLFLGRSPRDPFRRSACHQARRLKSLVSVLTTRRCCGIAHDTYFYGASQLVSAWHSEIREGCGIFDSFRLICASRFPLPFIQKNGLETLQMLSTSSDKRKEDIACWGVTMLEKDSRP